MRTTQCVAKLLDSGTHCEIKHKRMQSLHRWFRATGFLEFDFGVCSAVILKHRPGYILLCHEGTWR
eukprot:1107908-Rhodomonas_salina.5